MRFILAGALGEVGCSLHFALSKHGHDVVPVSSRAPVRGAPDVLGLPDVGSLVSTGAVDALVQAGGPGDHRARQGDVHQWTSELLEVCAELPSVLISTTRVLEGYQQTPPESGAGKPSTAYGQVNTDHEQMWLTYPNTRILRMVNYFCSPARVDSPQAQLLPWSLLVEGWRTGRISVRSADRTVREFIDAADASLAIEALLGETPNDRIAVATPGLVASLKELGEASIQVCNEEGRPGVVASFGSESSGAPWQLSPGWLSQRGWASELTLDSMVTEMSRWLVEWGPSVPDSGREEG